MDAVSLPHSASGKPKRVRTGCLTCRERHLKCDEGQPVCHNCQKSNRTCKRGMRLNFIDPQVKDSEFMPPASNWQVQFHDESREIASEYRGGLSKYNNMTEQIITLPQGDFFNSSTHSISRTLHPGQHILAISQRPIGCLDNTSSKEQATTHAQGTPQQHIQTKDTISPVRQPSPSSGEHFLTPPVATRETLTSPEELLFMQVFVEEVGIWMDSMDSQKNFSRLLPFYALSEPMLLNAILACGARQLTLDPVRETVICATTAVILNVYEMMSERAIQRMNHIAGARALIKECNWNATSTGVGAACFWLNVGMELLSCLHFNWQSAWDPDDWALDMDFHRDRGLNAGTEELWVHRMLYIIGKITNFRATVPQFQEASPHDEQLRSQRRYAEWERLKCLCDQWYNGIPRTMHPVGVLQPSQTRSTFPEIWLIKRSTIIGRLFYHTAMCLLPQINPLNSKESPEMYELSDKHAHCICGIVAHVKDRGVASVAIRSLAIASECLVIRREQEEVLQIFEKIRKETGWRVGFISNELKKKWGWVEDSTQRQMLASPAPFFPPLLQAQVSRGALLSIPLAPRSRSEDGILNPLF